MRWLLDENVPLLIARKLVSLGQDVTTVVALAPGAADAEVLSIACEEARALVSLDRDFGNLIFAVGHSAPPAVIYLRILPRDSEQMETLARIDTVAYVRFASVYRNFQAADDFDKFIDELRPGGTQEE